MAESEWSAVLDRAVAEHQGRPGALLPILHRLQESLGWVPPEAIAPIARALNQSIAEVHGVVSFYHDFRTTPPGRHTIQICRAESCQAMGVDRLIDHVTAELGIGFHETTPDGAFTLEPAFCLGQCACSPAMRIDGDVYGRVTPSRFEDIMRQLKART